METFTTSQSRSWVALVVVAGLFYLAGQLIAFRGQKAISPSANREISVSGMGEIQAKPDIAQISLGVTTGVQPSAKEANDVLAVKFQGVVAAVKALGIADEDVKTTNLAVNPVYDYTSGKQVLRGYEANQNIEVKIRNLDIIGEVVSKTTAEGINQVGGVSLTMDKPEKLQEQAEHAAIEDAQRKAKELAKQLGVRLGRVKYYSVINPYPDGPPVPLAFSADTAVEKAAPSTPVPTGSQTITANVSVTYELR